MACDCRGTHSTCPNSFDFSRTQNLKPHDNESEDSDNDSGIDAFAEELDSN